jgi:hypothetical protein
VRHQNLVLLNAVLRELSASVHDLSSGLLVGSVSC